MVRQLNFESWNDSYYEDSEVTFLIVNSKEKSEEFYKISSLNDHGLLSYIIKNKTETKGNFSIDKSLYKELWNHILVNKFSELKSYFTYSFDTGITFLINIRVKMVEKKITGMGTVTHHLETLLSQLREMVRNIDV